jgi:hypothetical protein
MFGGDIKIRFKGEPMRKGIFVVAAVTLLALALVTVAMTAEPFAGAWKLNVVKSKINSSPPPKSEIATFTAQENGLKLVVDIVESDGKAVHVTYAAKFDGKDYSVSGMTDIDTIVIKRVDASTFSELFKKAGKEVGNASLVVSKDGKTLTRTSKEKNAKGQDVTNTAVYEKQ